VNKGEEFIIYLTQDKEIELLYEEYP